MRKLSSLAVALLTSSALADGIPTSPNDVPLFYGVLGENPKYHDAAFKAQEAFLIQSGFTPVYNQLNSYVASKATNTATYAVDTYTPFKAKDVAFVGGAAYAVFVKKSITQNFSNPIDRSISHTISVTQNSVSTSIRIPFR
jgi:hypothetical protein